MKHSIKILSVLAILVATMFSSCSTTTEEEDDVTPTARELSLTVESTSNSVTLSWPKDDEISWYIISYAKNGETLVHFKDYQDLRNETISVTIPDLEASSFYDVQVEGKDYLSGGKVIASKKTTINTK